MDLLTLENEIDQILTSDHADPFHILGIHLVEPSGDKTAGDIPGIIIRTFLPDAVEAWVLPDDQPETAVPMKQLRPEGFFQALFPDRHQIFSYRLKKLTSDGQEFFFHDPYCFPPVLTDFDLHLIGEGSHYKKYEKLGAHLMTLNGVSGVFFAVWAPNAQRVGVIGDFNWWDGRRHPMRSRGGSGLWELFIPGLQEGTLYKFELKTQGGQYLLQKVDPYAFYFEVVPKSASIVHRLDPHQWQDQSWMESRPLRNWFESPIAIYEIHPGSWMRVPEENNRYLTYQELGDKLIPYVKQMGFTHIELLPITEHPFDGSWGYQTIGYFAPTSRFGSPQDFMDFVDRCHQNEIGVILDWVPAHFPKDGHGLAFFDGTCLYEHADPRKGEHRDWGTLIFNYGRNEVRSFLMNSALFWLDKYHLDGMRVDAVASMLYLDYSRQPGEWIPNQFGGNENLEAIDFIKKFNEMIHHYHPGVLTIAEESTAWPAVSRPTYLGGLGFSLKWNMGWMNDILSYFTKDPIHRKFHQNNLTFALMYAFTENFILPLSHDEVVHGKQSLLDKMPGYLPDKFSNLRLLLTYMYSQPGKKLLFMGGEFGQWREWDHDTSLDWDLLQWDHHRKLNRFVQDLNHLYTTQPAFYEVDFHYTGFEWIDFHDADKSIISFIRRARNPEDFLIFIFNFTPILREGYRTGVPQAGFYQEILNSDSEIYGGFNYGNSGGLPADEFPWQGRPYSLMLTLPPLAGLIFKLVKP